MSAQSHNNQHIITGYLDTLLVDNFIWDEKLARAINAPIRPQDTINKEKCLSVTERFGSGTSTQKYVHLLRGLSLVQKLPSCRVKKVLLNSCRPLAAEVLTCD